MTPSTMATTVSGSSPSTGAPISARRRTTPAVTAAPTATHRIRRARSSSSIVQERIAPWVVAAPGPGGVLDDIDHLLPGRVLIIPRVSGGGHEPTARVRQTVPLHGGEEPRSHGVVTTGPQLTRHGHVSTMSSQTACTGRYRTPWSSASTRKV